jgi:hypothetical protein
VALLKERRLHALFYREEVSAFRRAVHAAPARRGNGAISG